MYEEDVDRDQIVIFRNKLIDIIFNIGLEQENGYDTLIMAVDIADRYVFLSKGNYTTELAHVVLIIANKINEDHGYKSIQSVSKDINYNKLGSLERNVLILLNFTFPRKNIISYIGYHLDPDMDNKKIPLLPSIFWDLSKQICKNNLTKIHPKKILISLLMLVKYRKNLKFLKSYKKRVFFDIISAVSNEYDIDFSTIVLKYIEIKSKF